MYSDLLFNLTQLIEDSDLDSVSQVLAQMASNKAFFALDSGIKADDIWHRVQTFQECLDLIEDSDLKKNASQMIYFSAGIMPDLESVENRYEYIENLEDSINEFKDSDSEFANRLIAIGPCGIDHDWESLEYEGRQHDYFDYKTVSDERDLFALQMALAKKLNMPVIVHSRKGFNETSDVLKAIQWNRGVIHGYSYSKSELDFFLDLGWYISFSGAVTYSGKKAAADMAEIIDYVPKDRILIESDSPYYAPVPFKNTINTPANMKYIYEYVSSKKGIPSSKLGNQIDDNFKKLFL
ncbi:MAG: TatD family hydrolase [Treponema sp.]|nr:TatD family hydrolase [Treponema sp.]